MSYMLSACLSQGTIFYAFEHADIMGKMIVLLLFLGSIAAWTIMLEKGYSLRERRKAAEHFINLFRSGKPVVSYIRDADNCSGPIAKVYEAGAEKLIEYYRVDPEHLITVSSIRQLPKIQISEAQMEALRAVMEREVSSQIFKLENNMGVLATAVSVSPMLGLFGTVWGVMIAFCGVAMAGNASISSLAPGISGALVTTIGGMAVAVPSIVGYNLLAITIRKITVMMDNFVEEFLARVRLEQLE